MNSHINLAIEKVITRLNNIKHVTPKGGEYWTGRELMNVLEYAEWRNFLGVINKAIEACVSMNVDKYDHFVETNKMITAGKGARIEQQDYYLTRYACYLIAQNGDPSKTAVAAAQTYFAIQTRLQERTQENSGLEQRIHLRKRVTTAVKELNKAAKKAGVQNYAAFQNAGYIGLYSMGLADIKKRKNISSKEDLFDRAGRAELAANEFRLTQAEEKIKREDISNEEEAVVAHKQVGEEVRATICKIGGTMLEDLPVEPSLKKLTKPITKKLALHRTKMHSVIARSDFCDEAIQKKPKI